MRAKKHPPRWKVNPGIVNTSADSSHRRVNDMIQWVGGDCPMFRRFYVQKVLCSENICSKGSMFRRFYIQKVLCSEGPRLCSEGPIFRRSYVQKVLCSENICSKGPIAYSEGSMFRRSYIQIYSEGPSLYSENSLFDVGKNLHLSVSGKLQFKITNHSLTF